MLFFGYYVYKGLNMVIDNSVLEGSPEWESICEQCGMCCLVKYCDAFGNIYITNVRCAGLDKDTHKCKCYSADMKTRDNGCENCIALGGMRVTRETLNNSYPVPSFCPYVQKFCKNKKSKKIKQRPYIDWKKTVCETEIEDSLEKHVISGSNKYFKYNPHVNKQIHEKLKGLIH